MKAIIEQDGETGEYRLFFRHCKRYSDSTYQEFEIKSVYGLSDLIEWAIRKSYVDGLCDGRTE
jgi:hypothetical protein